MSLVFMIHHLGRRCEPELYEYLFEARKKWGDVSVHLDVFTLPEEKALELTSRYSCLEILTEADENHERVVETADRLYSESYIGDVYSDPRRVLLSAIKLEEDNG